MAVRGSLQLKNFMPDPMGGSEWFHVHCKVVIFTKNRVFDEFLKEIRRIFTLLLTFYQSFSSKQVVSDHLRSILSIPLDWAWIFWSVAKEVFRMYVGIATITTYGTQLKKSFFPLGVRQTNGNRFETQKLMLLFYPFFFFDALTLTLTFLSIFRCSCCCGKTKLLISCFFLPFFPFFSFLLVDFAVVSRLEIPTLCR